MHRNHARFSYPASIFYSLAFADLVLISVRMIGLFVPRNLHLLYRVIALPDDVRMRFEELAASFEYEHGHQREDAEVQALTVVRLLGPGLEFYATIEGKRLQDLIACY